MKRLARGKFPHIFKKEIGSVRIAKLTILLQEESVLIVQRQLKREEYCTGKVVGIVPLAS